MQELERSSCRRWWAVLFYKYIFNLFNLCSFICANLYHSVCPILPQHLCQFYHSICAFSTTVFVKLHQCICASTGNEGMQQAMVGRGKATPETDQVPTRQYSFPSALFKEKTWEAWNLKVCYFGPNTSLIAPLYFWEKNMRSIGEKILVWITHLKFDLNCLL